MAAGLAPISRWVRRNSLHVNLHLYLFAKRLTTMRKLTTILLQVRFASPLAGVMLPRKGTAKPCIHYRLPSKRVGNQIFLLKNTSSNCIRLRSCLQTKTSFEGNLSHSTAIMSSFYHDETPKAVREAKASELQFRLGT